MIPEEFREKISTLFITGESPEESPFANLIVESFPNTFNIYLKALLFQIDIKKVYNVNVQVTSGGELIVNTDNAYQVQVAELESNQIYNEFATTFVKIQTTAVNVASSRILKIKVNLKYDNEIVSSLETFVAVVEENA